MDHPYTSPTLPTADSVGGVNRKGPDRSVSKLEFIFKDV